MSIHLSRADARKLGLSAAGSKGKRAPAGTERVTAPTGQAGVRPAAGGPKMNKLEARFAEQLEAWRHWPNDVRNYGVLHYWQFEAVKLILADRCTYTPDFLAVFRDATFPTFVFFEVKGFFRDDAKVKIKVAARQFSFWKFVVVTFKRGEWQFTEIPS